MKTSYCISALILALAAGSSPALAQPAPSKSGAKPMAASPSVVSPEVHADRTVTFRLFAPTATEVHVAPEVSGSHAMTKDAQGVWSVTAGPFKPQIYDYSFFVDGARMVDPCNSQIKNQYTSLLLVPGHPAEIFEVRPVPHGTVAMVWYESGATKMTRRFFIYTPPGYEAGADKFPVIYLLHGRGGTEADWTQTGNANFIMDNLVAAGKAVPAILVMPLGQTPRKEDGVLGRSGSDFAIETFEDDLLNTIIPLVESRYRTYADPAHRAIAGLSMGGLQSAYIGINHPELFGYVGILSMAVRSPDDAFKPLLAHQAESEKNLKLVWVGIGKTDGLIGPENAQKMVQWLDAHNIKTMWEETDLSHEWVTFRTLLADMLPQFFQDQGGDGNTPVTH